MLSDENAESFPFDTTDPCSAGLSQRSTETSMTVSKPDDLSHPCVELFTQDVQMGDTCQAVTQIFAHSLRHFNARIVQCFLERHL